MMEAGKVEMRHAVNLNGKLPRSGGFQPEPVPQSRSWLSLFHPRPSIRWCDPFRNPTFRQDHDPVNPEASGTGPNGADSRR